ncbi:helix-hairpin-helix domain-containing protein [Lysobacter stagni]|uniref:helix-hairpin-helix domain-containing protein n=1 Tax=Lysobacter stagni TaxID=3045172 RepID=UPI0031F3070B
MARTTQRNAGEVNRNERDACFAASKEVARETDNRVGRLVAFSPQEREVLLSVSGIGPTVVERLEQIGFNSLQELAGADVLEVVASVAGLVGSRCWRNSPLARSAVQAAIDLARSRQNDA